MGSTFSSSVSSSSVKPTSTSPPSLIQILNQITTIKLDRGTFLLWKTHALPVLRSYNLEGHLSGEIPRPPMIPSGVTETSGATRSNYASGAFSSSVSRTEVNPQFGHWAEINQVLLDWLYKTITPEVAPYVMGYYNAKDLWAAIQRLFDEQSQAEKNFLRQVFQQTRKGSLKMTEYLRIMKSHANNLGQAGSSSLISQVLLGLDEEYNPVVAMVQGRFRISWSQVQDELLGFEKHLELPNTQKTNLSFSHNVSVNMVNGRGQNAGNQRPPQQFNSNRSGQKNNTSHRGGGGGRNRGRGRWQGNNSNNRPVCQVCGKFGHISLECHHGVDKESASSNQNTKGANTNRGISSSGGSNSYSPAAFVAAQNNPFVAAPKTVINSNWYIDSGASNHVTTNYNTRTHSSEYGGGCSSRTSLTSIKILTYNVWFREDLEMHNRMRALGQLIQCHSPDVICFQEVTPDIYNIFQITNWWKVYCCSVMKDAHSKGYFCMLLSKLPVKSFSCQPFANSIMGRELCIANLEVQKGISLTVATSHLESPCPAPPRWNQMYSKERVIQAREAIDFLKETPNVIFGGDMNWDDNLDGRFFFPDGWIDAWEELRPGENGWTYDTISNKMLSGNRRLQKRLDRFFCKLQDFKVRSIEMIGTNPIPNLTYTKEKTVGKEMKMLELPVLPSDHYGLLLTISNQPVMSSGDRNGLQPKFIPRLVL